MKGWFRDSYKHSLAARGIKTSFYAKKIPIPPGWRNIKHYDDRNYVATGIDCKGRVQYIYPKSFIDKKADKKYKRVEKLDKKMPVILSRLKKDIEKEVPEAEAVYAIHVTGFRPGTERETLADKKAYGVSTLKPEQVKVSGDKVDFKFTGKKGVEIEKSVKDKLLSNIIKRKKGKDKVFSATDIQMRGYFNNITKNKFQLKDLRALRAKKIAESLKGDKKQIAAKVSQDLCNTPAVALKSYVSPQLISS